MDDLGSPIPFVFNNCLSVKAAEQQAEIERFTEAEAEANQGNKAKAFEALAKVGRWSLDTVTAIGTRVAAEAIKISLGM